MRTRRLVLVTLLLVVVCIAAFWLAAEIAIDRCLDAGRVWHGAEKECIEDAFALQKQQCFEAGGKWAYPEEACRHGRE